MTTTEISSERLEEIKALADKVFRDPLGQGSWSVKAARGKPILSGGPRGNIADGYIATWDEFELIAAVLNSLPTILTELRDRRAAGGEACEQAASDALDFVMTRLPAINKEKGLVGVWMNAWRTAWEASRPAQLVQEMHELDKDEEQRHIQRSASQDQEGTWSDGGKEWTPEPAQETPKSMHVEDDVHREVVITDEMVERLRQSAFSEAGIWCPSTGQCRTMLSAALSTKKDA